MWDGHYVATYTNKSFFVDATLHITSRLALSVGARHSSQNVDATRTDFSDVFASAPPTGNSTIQEPVSESKTTPRATVTFAATDQVNLYAAYSKGFRIGGHNPIGNLTTPGCPAALADFGITDPQDAAEFKSDAIKNDEVGIKSAFENGRVTANLTVFRVDWTDLQTTINLDQYQRAAAPRSSATPAPRASTASSATFTRSSPIIGESGGRSVCGRQDRLGCREAPARSALLSRALRRLK